MIWWEDFKVGERSEMGRHTFSEAEIIAFARSRIAAFKAPKSIEFVAALPRNASGKILRREIRDRYWAGRERRVN